jgi:hypothetical protein
MVIAKARNQMDDIDFEDETIDAEILIPKAVCMTIPNSTCAKQHSRYP